VNVSDALSEIEAARLAVEEERQYLEAHLRKLSKIDVDPASNEERLDFASMTLSRIYTAVEDILKRLVGIFETVPSKSNWHSELLKLASTSRAGLRPEILSSHVSDGLSKLRAF